MIDIDDVQDGLLDCEIPWRYDQIHGHVVAD